MAKLQSGTRIYGTANVDTGLYVNSTFVANATQITITGIPLNANSTNGISGYVLTSNGNSGSPYWAASVTDTVNNANHVIYANYRTVTGSTNNIVANDSLILANSTSNITLTLPSAATSNGSIFNIKNINTGYVTVVGSGTDQIDGQANLVIQFKNSYISFLSTSTGWIKV